VLNRLGLCIAHPESILHYIPYIPSFSPSHSSITGSVERRQNLQPSARPSTHQALDSLPFYDQPRHIIRWSTEIGKTLHPWCLEIIWGQCRDLLDLYDLHGVGQLTALAKPGIGMQPSQLSPRAR
jgi:hypothetical protein